jgi:sec-independent protein translocase protein TatC
MAKKTSQPLADPEDLFADTRMSFGDHIEDLRSHLVRAVVGFAVALAVCLLPPIGPWAMKIITAPVEEQLQAFYDRYYEGRFAELKNEAANKVPAIRTKINIHLPTLRRYLESKKADALPDGDQILVAVDDLLLALGFDPGAGEDRSKSPDWALVPVEIPNPIALSKAMTDIGRIVRPERLSSFNVQEVFIVYFKVGMLVGFVVSSPWVFYQIWSFVAAGLYPHEKKLVNYYLPFSVVLFLAGALVCQFLALPKAIEALLWFNEWLGVAPDLRLNEWLSFALVMPFVFGLSFQTPIVMLFMFKIGVADIETFRNKRRICYFLMAIFAAVITPSTDVANMMLLWIPMCLLFELGIWLCILQPKSLSDEMDEAELDEMVGV